MNGQSGLSGTAWWGNQQPSCSRPHSTTPRTWTPPTGWLGRWRHGSAPASRTSNSRLVGKPVEGVQRLHRPPAVTVVGLVPAMEPELARADVAVVPLRYGSGTRLKILESFAHRVPVVSTTVGAEGLLVEDGVHLLLADDPESFAAACQRLLTEPDLRKQLVEAAEERYQERYECSVARQRIQALVREVVGDADAQR